MVTRREKMKHSLCDLQEKIFQLQIQLLEEDMAGGKRHDVTVPLVLFHPLSNAGAKTANTHSFNSLQNKYYLETSRVEQLHLEARCQSGHFWKWSVVIIAPQETLDNGIISQWTLSCHTPAT